MAAKWAQLPSRWVVRAGRIAFAEGGSATVEYALLIALVVAVCGLGVDAVGLTANRAFLRLGSALDGQRRRAEASHDEAVAVVTSRASNETSAWSPWLHVARLPFTCAALGFVAVAWTRSRRRTTAPEAEEQASLARLEGLAEMPMQQRYVAKRQEILQSLRAHPAAVVHDEVAVGHVMTTWVLTAAPTATVEHLADLMKREQFRHVLICDDGSRLLGMVSDRDLAARGGRSAVEVMTRNPVTVTPQTNVRVAISTMLVRRISCLPVIDPQSGRLQGIVTTTDVAMAMQCTMQLLHQMTQALLSRTGQLEAAATGQQGEVPGWLDEHLPPTARDSAAAGPEADDEPLLSAAVAAPSETMR